MTVVLASGGYPGSYRTGLPIEGVETVPEDVLIFHAGTKRQDHQLVTAGGRVLNISAVAPTFEEARQRVYAAIERIHFPGMIYRRDIALREVTSATTPTGPTAE